MKLYRLSVLLLALLAAACSAPAPRSSAQLSDEPTEADVIARSKLDGCELIPYDGRRATCIVQNDGLHGVAACGAQACQKGAGNQANRERLVAWKSCVDRRTLINAQFDGTTQSLGNFKRTPVYKSWSQKGKNAMAVLLEKIDTGKPGHKTALNNAKIALDNCERIVQ